MRKFAFGLVAATATIPATAFAMEGVVASIKPVHSLVAGVMEGVDTPSLIVRGAGSPHNFSLRPSDATMLEEARLVFWVGRDLETFLEAPLRTLATNASLVTLQEAPDLVRLGYREGGAFETHTHGHDHDHTHTHDHGFFDLHLWLDPENAKAMVGEIERALSEADPDNAERYGANAADMRSWIDDLTAEIEPIVASLRDRPFIVFHDAYHYFENRFGLQAGGAITINPEAAPGAQRLTEIRAQINEVQAGCVFAEPQFEPRVIDVVIEGTDARTGILDPLGAEIEPGPDLYFLLLRSLATSFADCLSPQG